MMQTLMQSTYSAIGANGENRIVEGGTANCNYDISLGKYTTMSIVDTGSFFASWYRWVIVAVEALGGGIIGNTLAPGIGALPGAALGIAFSEYDFEDEIDGATPTQPSMPPAPSLPPKDIAITPSPNQIITRVAGDGNLSGNRGNQVYLVGNWSNGAALGTGGVIVSKSGNSGGGPTPSGLPTLTQWGMITFILLLLTKGIMFVQRKRKLSN